MNTLGKATTYIDKYQPDLLFAIPRSKQREPLGIHEAALPFYGHDLWNTYELSWLNLSGKPIVAIAQCLIPCNSSFLIESKSFKLYLNSLHQTPFENVDAVTKTLQQDLSKALNSALLLEIATLDSIHSCELRRSEGICLDHLDVTIHQYTPDPSVLITHDSVVTESVYSDAFRSNCPVTHQPDWASIQIDYTGPQIDHESLLKYLISFRKHTDFHEACIEHIFIDLMRCCHLKDLTVTGRYTRRGGIDINPCRSTNPEVMIDTRRFFRQ